MQKRNWKAGIPRSLDPYHPDCNRLKKGVPIYSRSIIERSNQSMGAWGMYDGFRVMRILPPGE